MRQTGLRPASCRNAARRRRPARVVLWLETLESRDLPSGFQSDYVLLPEKGGATPFSSPGPTGYTPAQIKHAYGFDQIAFNNGTVAGDGAGTTIAIVDAYDDPNIANDLHQFDQAFNLPDPTFTKVNENGGGALPAANASWAVEISLDVEWRTPSRRGRTSSSSRPAAPTSPTCWPGSPTPPRRPASSPSP